MAPIHSENTYTVHSSSSTMKPFSCACRGALSDSWEWFLPITRRGHFFQDSFFENGRSHFDAAIRDVLGRWGENSMLTDAWHDTANNFSRYRQLRSRNLNEENQAVTVSSDNNSHKIMLDVHDFMEGELKVKVIGETEVLVEGHREKRREEEGSTSSQKFSRRFPLPQSTNVEAITSVMSSDGILTITAPKKTSATSQEGIKIQESKGVSSSTTSQTCNTEAQSTQKSSEATAKSATMQETCSSSERYCENCYKKLQAEKKTSEESIQQEGVKIPIKINTSLLENEKTSHSQETQNTFESKSLAENMKTSSSLNTQADSSKLTKEESRLSNQSDRKQSFENNEKSTSSVSTDGKTSSMENKETPRNIPISVNFRSSLPITRRGLFFNDSIFENARNDFQTAVQEVLSKWGERSSIMDDLTCYRNLRTRDLREENQAVKVNEDESNHKFVLDVHDFMNGGEVNVKAVNDRELVVEGQVEKQEGGSKSAKRFYKRFVLPSDIKLESVSSVVSSDGVLTITAPKKPPTIEIRDVTSPIRTEKIQESSSENKQQSVTEKHNTATQSSSPIRTEKIQESSSENKQQSVTEKHNTATQSSAVTSKSIHESCESPSSDTHHTSSSHQMNLAKEQVIPVHVEGMSNEVKVNHTAQMATTSSDTERSQDKILKNNVESSVNEEKTTTSIGKQAENCSEENRREIKITKNNAKSSEVNNTHVSAVNQESHNTDSLNCSFSSAGRMLPITRKGSFFNDSFFEKSRHSFQTAVRDILLKFNENSNFDDITTYRDLRQRNLTFENQAFNVHEDEHCHKVVLDARDFIEGDITVSVVGEKELLIEGRTEDKKDSSASSLSFTRRFLLPESVDIHSITSAISSDGILTVESPKKGSGSSLSDVKKMSSEAHSRQENHNDSGHKWEEKAVKESSEQSQGYSSRSYSSSYRAHQQQSSTNVF